MSTPVVDRLVADYLARLDAASVALPPDRRDELLEEIRGHIDGARAAGAAADEAAVRTLLDRLGPPEVIVEAARDDDAPPPAWTRPGAATGPVRRPGTGLETAAVLLLTAGSLVPLAGWLLGVVLLWTSQRWSRGEKLLGTLVVPLGPGGVLYAAAYLFPRAETCVTSPLPLGPDGLPVEPPPGAVECTTSGLTGSTRLALGAVAVVAAVVVAVLLLRRAQRRAALEPPRPAGASPWGGLEVAAVLLLALGGFVVPVVGPAVGLVLVWCSSRWTGREKAVATALSVVPLLLLALLPLGALLIARVSL